jgi:hypothetical protein
LEQKKSTESTKKVKGSPTAIRLSPAACGAKKAMTSTTKTLAHIYSEASVPPVADEKMPEE